MKVKDILKEFNQEPKQFHIFDSHQESMLDQGKSYKDQDYVVYNYNIHRNNKPKEGDVFLYRRPGRSTKDHKFYIFGGGIISKIEKIGDAGEVNAKIEYPFKFNEPIMQDDLENFDWHLKERKSGRGWSNFWNQYGINTISKEDFDNLVDDRRCHKPEIYDMGNPELSEALEEDKYSNEIIEDFSGFNINISIDGSEEYLSPKKVGKKPKVIHPDYGKIQEKKQKLGLQGELLVYQYLKEHCKSDILIEHSSVEKGDGLGYDILVEDKNGLKNYIEVKTTRKNRIDGFYITPKEYEKLKKDPDHYKIYNVYDFNPGKKKANIKIISGSDIEKNYKKEPVAWKLFKKKS